MDYPVEFYYSEAQSDIDYQTMPTGNLSVPRLIKNKTYWIRPVAPHAQKQKNLVLADWSFLNCSKERFNAVKAALNQLMEEGFSIYYWQDGTVIPLTKERIDDLLYNDVRQKMRPAYTDEITVAAIKQHGLTHDNVQVVDTYLLEHVLQGKPPEEGRTIRLSDYLALDKEARQRLIEIMVKANPPVSALIQDVFEEDSHFPEMLLQQFPDAKILDRFEKVILSGSDINNLLSHGSISRGEKTLSIENLPQLKDLIIDQYVNNDDLQSLLSKTPNLRTIEVLNTPLSQHFSLIQDSLPLLETASFRNADVSGDGLQGLLNAAPNLTTLDCLGLKAFSGQSLLSTERVLKLTEINLTNSQASKEDIESLLIRAPLIQKLNLSGCQNIRTLSIDDKSLSNLTELNLSKSNITIDALEKWLRAAPKLKYLHLSSCEMWGNLKSIPDGLKHLEELTLNNSGLNPTSLETLLENASQLKRLSLCNCFLIGLTKTRNFPELEELDLTGSNIVAAGLSLLIAAAPKLKKLNIDRCDYLGDPLEIDAQSLLAIEELHLNSNNICSQGLGRLLSMTPQLKKLSLALCNNLADIMILDSAILCNLEEITLNHCKINPANLDALLKAAPKLKTLSISTSNDFKAIQPENLPHLTALQISGYQCEAASLQRLLTATPNIDTLTIEFDDIIGDISVASLNRPHLKKMRISLSKKNTEKMHALLNAAPHMEELELDYLGPLSLQPGFFKNLKQVKISSLTTSNLQALITAAPNLQKIVFDTCDVSNTNFNLRAGSLANLEEIKFTPQVNADLDEDFYSQANKTTFASKALEKLLLAAPNLKSLTLGNHQDLSKSFNIPPNSLEKLEEITLDSSMSIEMIQNLLLAAPNLKRLTLTTGPLLGSLSLPPGSLLHLESLNAANAYLGDESFKSLRNAAPYCQSFNTPPTRERLPYIVPQAPIKPYKGSATIDVSLMKEFLEMLFAQGLTTHRNYLGESEFLDADTEAHDDLQLHATTIFHSLDNTPTPAVENYRLMVHNTVATNPNVCSLNQAFTMRNEGDEQLTSCDVSCSETDVFELAKDLNSASHPHVYGKQSLQVGAKWQAIASLSPNEKMKHYHVNPNQADIEIKYSKRDNLYYIRSKMGEQHVDLDFVLELPKPSIASPSEISNLVNVFLSFKPGNLVIDKENATGDDYLRYILDQKKGACRHRSFAFVAVMQRLYPDIPVRIVNNDCHSFAEVQIQGQWLECQLGGYPAMLEITDPYHPEQPQKEEPEVIYTTLDTGSKEHPVPTAPTTQAFNASALQPSQGTETTSGETPRDEYQAYFERQLQTWQKTKLLTNTLLEYCQQCTKPDNVNKRLIELSSSEDVNALHWALRQHCKSTNHPVFYANSPDDLICSAPYVQRHDDNTGEIKKGPGGPLYDFLTAPRDHSENDPIIIVNYDNFTADDLVRFNGLLDKERRADGTPLADNVRIVGLLNANKPNCYQGADFYSRFDTKETCPISSRALAAAIPQLPHTKNTEVEHVINLYRAVDWEDRLLGRWTLNQHDLTFQQGELVNALEKGATTIAIQNGLWENEAFQRFWQEAILRGTIESAGRSIAIPEGFQLIRRDGYDWTKLKSSLQQIEQGTSPDGLAVNPSRLGLFFNGYLCDNTENTLIKTMGIAEQFAHQDMIVNVTRSLGADEWAMLLAACNEQDVRLIVHCAPGVELPAELSVSFPTEKTDIPAWNGTTSLPTEVIASTDVDTTVALLTRENDPLDIIIDVSECKPSDLLWRTDGKLTDDNPPKFKFVGSAGILLEALGKNTHPERRVILKGKFSDELSDELAQYLIERNGEPPFGKLVIIPENNVTFHGVACSTHTVTVEDKLTCLARNDGWNEQIRPDDATLLAEPLSQLQARFFYQQTHPETTSSDNAWEGLYRLEPGMQNVGEFNEATAENESMAFTQNRVDAVNSILVRSPYAFLTGLSGVGKSTFVEQNLCQKGERLYQSEEHILKWVKDTAPGRKVLFIDEANLSAREWSEFEGLFHTPPGILIDGKFYPLSPDHKVIFAGNPCSYGDERKLAPFFQRHGNAVVFNPLPPASIYQLVLKPIFENTQLSPQTADISSQILNVYRFLCACSEKEVLITPRELQMMAMLVSSYLDQKPDQDPIALARQVAWQLARGLVPAEKLQDFDAQFKPATVLPALGNRTLDPSYQITPSREPVSQQVDALLALRELRQRPGANSAQKYGGLGGLIIEGEPGNGKSELVISRLRSANFQEVFDLKNPTTVDKPFYRMPVSMSLEKKEELLLKAFHEGAVVVVDEINSSPMMERLLNSLLMGKTPDNQRPHKPGFMVIGTQNPVTMAGRRVASTALKRRMITMELPSCPHDEIISILLSKKVPATIAVSLTNAYESQVAYAKANHLSPAPTMRDLIRKGEQVVLARQNAQRKPVTINQQELSKPNQEPAIEKSTPTEVNADKENAQSPVPDKEKKLAQDFRKTLGEMRAQVDPEQTQTTKGTPAK